MLWAGLGTLLFHFLTKGKVPAFLGSSFAFLGGYAAVAPLSDGQSNIQMLPYACGGVVVAGALYLLIALLIKVVGVNKVMRFFPPVVTGPIIIAIGLILAPSAITNCATNWPIALVALLVVIVCNIWGKGMIKIIPIMMGILVAYVVALVTGNVDFTLVKETLANGFIGGIIGLPVPEYGLAKFDVSDILTVAPIALATIMEHIGDISAIGATVDKNYIKDPGLHRTLLGDGLATMLASFFGGPANTTYGENTGVLVLSKVYDPVVVRIAACVAVVLSFFPVVSAVIRSIPPAIPHPLRYELCHRCPQRGGASGGPDQEPQPDYRRSHSGLRAGLQRHRRHHLHRLRHCHHPVRPGYCLSGRHYPQRHPARQRLSVREGIKRVSP